MRISTRFVVLLANLFSLTPDFPQAIAQFATLLNHLTKKVELHTGEKLKHASCKSHQIGSIISLPITCYFL
jgi:hypothetical protein